LFVVTFGAHECAPPAAELRVDGCLDYPLRSRVVARRLAAAAHLRGTDARPLTKADRAITRRFDLDVLVADDDPVGQRVVRKMLQRLGCRVQLASDGREAVDLVEAHRFDLVLMDCQMPSLNGFDATAQIRKRESTTARTTIVAVTAHAMSGDRERCLAAGMDDHLSKPFTLGQLEAFVARVTNPASARAESVEPAIDNRRAS
jgi:two-component system, sensor histidine kinase and response regulator